MTIDWNQFESDAHSAAEAAGNKTDAQLATQIARYTRLTESQIKTLFPDSVDAKNAASLLKAVNSATDENESVAQLKDNIDAFAGVTVKLLKALA